MRRFEIYAWEPSVSPHKTGFYEKLARRLEVASVTYVAQTSLPPDRAKQGWELQPIEGVRFVVAPSDQEVAEIVRQSSPDAVHIFSGVHWVPAIVAGMQAVLAHGRRFGIMSEPRVLDDVRAPIRVLHSWITERKIRARAGFVLAIGRHGPRWFRLAGYAASKIFPFAYFISAFDAPARSDAVRDSDELRVGYLGRLERLKGVHLFLDALPSLRPGVTAHVAGVGTEQASVEQVARSSDGKLVYHGRLAMNAVPAFLSDIDILVTPSTSQDDGWCAAVSEALAAGAPVVASGKVGASMLLDDPGRGRVLRRLDGASIAEATHDLADSGQAGRARRLERRGWALSHLTDTAGAAQLVRVLQHVYEGGPKPSPFHLATGLVDETPAEPSSR